MEKGFYHSMNEVGGGLKRCRSNYTASGTHRDHPMVLKICRTIPRPFTTPGGRFSVRSGGIAFIGDNMKRVFHF